MSVVIQATRRDSSNSEDVTDSEEPSGFKRPGSPTLEDAAAKKYLCSKCPTKTFKSYKGYCGHLRVHAVTTCGKCQEKFSSRGQYHFHMATSHRRQVSCGLCDFKSEDPEKLVIHLMFHKDNEKHAKAILENFILDD